MEKYKAWSKKHGIEVSCNASGAARAGASGKVVVVVDVIDMSTTCEGALEAGALAVYGASPDDTKAPVALNPKGLGELAGQRALEAGTDIIIIAEPRVGTDEERLQGIGKVLAGIKATGAQIGAVVPNLGAETVKLVPFKERVVIAVTNTGGVAYDAAYTAGAKGVVTGTIARTIGARGKQPARNSAKRALDLAVELDTGVVVVAATANSLEDVLAAEYLAKEMMELALWS